MEPFLTVRGRLQKDGASLNVIAESVAALRVKGTPAPRPSNTRSYAAAANQGPAMAVRERPDEPEAFAELQTSLPDTQEYWRDPWPTWGQSTDSSASFSNDSARQPPGAFRYLTALRQSPPGIKSFG
jgi:hypothetical protein